jgi:hypothetical protein
VTKRSLAENDNVVKAFPVGSKKMKLLKGDSFPIFLVSDGVSQQSCRG